MIIENFLRENSVKKTDSFPVNFTHSLFIQCIACGADCSNNIIHTLPIKGFAQTADMYVNCA